MAEPEYFRFKSFTLRNQNAALKVNFDGVLLGAWVDVSNDRYILDVGTGSGVIALMANHQNPRADIDAIDLDASSYEEAQFNVQLNQKESSIKVYHSAIQSFKTEKFYDHLICNPPFFQKDTVADKDHRRISKHAENLSFGDILVAASKFIIDEGKLSLVYPAEEAESFIKKARQKGWYLIRKLITRSRPNTSAKRYFMTFARTSKNLELMDIHVHEEGRDNYSEAYKKLTKDFYLKF